MNTDMERRWRKAKLGERRGGRVVVYVECEGDPRAEVLHALAVLAEHEAEARGRAMGALAAGLWGDPEEAA